MAKGKLTLKEQRFVDAYLGSAHGNATQAAKIAGYSARTAKQAGSRLLTFVDVRQAIDARTTKATMRSILTAEERDSFLSSMVQANGLKSYLSAVAIKELNKCSGRHSIKHVLDVTEKLSDIIAGSREPE